VAHFRSQDICIKHNIFPQSVIEAFAAKLKKFNDKNLRQELENNDEKLMEIVEQYFHCG
jgi:glutamine synthetase